MAKTITEAQLKAEANFKPEMFRLTGQKKAIVAYIAEHGSITPLEAIVDKRIHSMKLATRIGEIETRCGYVFNREMVQDGDVRYMRYSFAKGLKAEDYDTILAQKIS